MKLKLIPQCADVFLNGASRLHYNKMVSARRWLWAMRTGRYHAPILLSDVEFGEGWAFFVSGKQDIADFVFSEAWALGWLAASADYSDAESIGQAVINNSIGNCLRKEQFWHFCNRVVNQALDRGEFVRLPVEGGS